MQMNEHELEPEREKTFFDLPSHLREIIWKRARQCRGRL